MTGRRTDWIVTHSGQKVCPWNPTPDTIRIEDIGIALSRIPRFIGHTRQFYSVAQHSVFLSIMVRKEFALWALLHDAAEAYIGDMPSPIKKEIPFFSLAEDKLLQCIADVFGLSWPMPAEVKKADNILLATEAEQLVEHTPEDWYLNMGEGIKPSKNIALWTAPPDAAFTMFMSRFNDLVLARDVQKQFGEVKIYDDI